LKQSLLALFAASALLAGGCAGSKGNEESSFRKPSGDWVVVSHRVPGVSAIPDSIATSWYGTEVHYGDTEATSGTRSCPQAKYRYHTARADSLLAIGYRIDPAELGYEGSGKSRIGVTQVLCANLPWKALGGFILWIDEDRLYALWDGAFFELQRKDASGGPNGAPNASLESSQGE
jgi:hypothetical protein